MCCIINYFEFAFRRVEHYSAMMEHRQLHHFDANKNAKCEHVQSCTAIPFRVVFSFLQFSSTCNQTHIHTHRNQAHIHNVCVNAYILFMEFVTYKHRITFWQFCSRKRWVCVGTRAVRYTESFQFQFDCFTCNGFIDTLMRMWSYRWASSNTRRLPRICFIVCIHCLNPVSHLVVL